MQCPAHENTRRELYNTIRDVGKDLERVCDFPVMMGRYIDGWDFESVLPIWKSRHGTRQVIQPFFLYHFPFFCFFPRVSG